MSQPNLIEDFAVAFCNAMTPEEKIEIASIERGLGAVHFSGSRWTCPAAVTEDSDIDIYVAAKRTDILWLADRGWEIMWSEYTGEELHELTPFVSLRFHRLNILAFLDQKWYAAFKSATAEAFSFRDTDKFIQREDRVTLYKMHQVAAGCYPEVKDGR